MNPKKEKFIINLKFYIIAIVASGHTYTLVICIHAANTGITGILSCGKSTVSACSIKKSKG
jgi:hypothetical protein